MQNFIIHGFENSLWLVLGGVFLTVLLACFLLKKTQRNFVDDNLLTDVYGTNSAWYRLYALLLVSISSLFFIILAQPYYNSQGETIVKNGIDIEIVFDVSYSMTAEDLLPSRLAAAKGMLVAFLSAIENDRVGLVLFAGRPFQSIPLSYDYDFISDFIGKIETDTIPQYNAELQGTAIGDAVILGSDVLAQSELEREKIMILITDGEAENGVNPELALKYARSHDIKIYTVGIGTAE
jgi:Ca-activated chloride channel family protein